MFNILINISMKYFSIILAFYAIYMLLRGHNEPGGGFIGGLLLTLAGIIYHSYTNEKSFLLLLIDHFNKIMGVLMILLMTIASLPLFFGLTFFKGLWTKVSLPIAGKFSSILIFDTLIFLIVSIGIFYSYYLIKNILLEDKNRV